MSILSEIIIKKINNEPKVLILFVSMFNRKRILNSRNKFLQIKGSLKIACERKSSCQSWREDTISLLEYHISNGLTCQLRWNGCFSTRRQNNVKKGDGFELMA